ncbi:uncharacterized protein BDW47DRAFT_66747 [Aspergillus candidus]|uniref:Mediator of RNA polymerase II transcription subunit 13 n=1 Tax=Aspergillus candidus TaxID=41067 RepID=A0A2I2FL36_ASPCN|nr:mediator complex subunit 13 C-terminal-domain-containing protein [Aspergillus candidus]PLB41339.1 mediator complex subunit 13 C-terminal-domain-containing protein [Aspergillus candidus]
MEFPGGSITNIRAIDGFSSIYWRIYTEEPNIASIPGETPANGYTILRHLSRLKDLELRLRNANCLVSSYPRRLGLWVFSATPDFESLDPLCPNQGQEERSRLAVDSFTLKASGSGSTTAADLIKNLSTEPQTPGQNASASQRPTNGPPPARRMDGYASPGAIYAAFISAVTGALSLQLIRRDHAIPLGSRTLFTAIEGDDDESPRIANDDPASIPTLTTLHVQLTSVGKLMISLQTVAQDGITRLSQPDSALEDIVDAPRGTDLWLSPSGSVARLVSANPDPATAPSPYVTADAAGNDRSRSVHHKQWKLAVFDWLKCFGLPVRPINEMAWVEIEVWEPFYSRLAGETWRLGEDNTPTLPLKRILWPAIYCFRRSRAALSALVNPLCSSPSLHNDPLGFAEMWRTVEIPKPVERDPMPLSSHQDQPPKAETDPGELDFPEGIESLSRASQYPELQTASLVYPTPPDGAASLGVNPTNATDLFVEDSSFGSLPNQTKVGSLAQMPTGDSDVPMVFGPAAGLVVGSGLYDTNEDDLFGDLDEQDFGDKGITDADFNFFDDADFQGLGDGPPSHGTDEMTDLLGAEPDLSPTVSMQPPVESEQPSDRQAPAEPIETPQCSGTDQQVKPEEEEIGPRDNTTPPSSQNDNNQTISPPLSPVEVKKIILPAPDGNGRLPVPKGQKSYYKPVAFKQDMSNWDQKYGAAGKFWFKNAPSGADKSTNTDGDIPTIGLPRHTRNSVVSRDVAKTMDGHGSPSTEMAQDDQSSVTSEGSDESVSDSESSHADLPTLKRKRVRSNSPSTTAMSHGIAPVEDEQDSQGHRAEDAVFLGNLLSTFSDWSMTGYFSLPDNRLLPAIARREVQVQIAQLLSDQVTQTSLNHKLDGDLGLGDCGSKLYFLRTSLEDTPFVGGSERLDLSNYASLQDTNNFLSPPSGGLTPRQSSQRREAARGSISKLPSPHLRVRRGKDYLEVLPAAISFWETFGLEPAHGPKNITAYCIHPHTAADAAHVFLERLSLAYTSCNLGTHSRGNESNHFQHGLGKWVTTVTGGMGYPNVMMTLKTMCEEFGAVLTQGVPKEGNIVLYIVNPFTHATALADICAAFWSLFQQYAAAADTQQTRQLNELVLQIVPSDFMMSAESLVVPPQTQYLNLALEVYSRCHPKPLSTSLTGCAPPVLLADSIPRSINFRLAPEKSSPLQDGRCLHIACSRSQDQRWLGVAWTDTSGNLQRNISYCLRFRNASAYTAMSDIRNEIWKATREMLDRAQARWRVMLAYTDTVDQEEIDAWSGFIDQYSKSNAVSLELTIFAVNTTTDLSLEPPATPIPMSIFSSQPASTPVATPNPSGSVLSPEQSANAPTPPSGGGAAANAPTPTDAQIEAESESTLMDIGDETWGVILSHRLNNSPHLTELRPVLASGYLLRRRGAADGDGVYSMCVNLIHTTRPSQSYEGILRESLGMYRGLATLARARGTVTVQHSTLPWHVATAVRAQEVLSYVL